MFQLNQDPIIILDSHRMLSPRRYGSFFVSRSSTPAFPTIDRVNGSLKSLEQIAARRSLLIGIVLAFVVGAAALAESRLPHGDEGHFANCAWEFIHHGRLALPMMTDFIPSLDRYVYENMPLYHIQLGVVSIFTGYEISTLRMDTVAWGVLLVVSTYFMVAGLTGDRLVAAMALLLVAVNYDVMDMCSGRYDAMCAALYMAGLACYVWWRERNLARAVFLSNCLIAAACMTHPYGVFGMAGFGVLFAMLDLRRISLRLVLIAAIPYAVALASWGLYIAQNPTEFYRQITTNGRGRLAPIGHPISAIVSEIRVRYLEIFAGFRGGVPAYMRLKVLLLLAYAAGFAGCLLTPSIRRDKHKLALVLVGISYAGLLTVGEGQRLYIFMIHVLPIYSVVLAIWGCYLLRRGGLWQKAVLAGVAIFCVYSIAAVVYRARLNEYWRLYEPTLEFLTKNVHGDEIVMAPGQFGTRLGFNKHCIDDATLGFRNGLSPTYIVMDPHFELRESVLKEDDPAAFSHVRSILDKSDLVFERQQGFQFYRVYRVRKQMSPRSEFS